MLNRHLNKVSRRKIRDVNTVNSVLNWKALVGTFNPEKALRRRFVCSSSAGSAMAGGRRVPRSITRFMNKMRFLARFRLGIDDPRAETRHHFIVSQWRTAAAPFTTRNYKYQQKDGHHVILY